MSLKDTARAVAVLSTLHDTIGDHRFFPTIGAAVAAYVRESGVDWLDWEDRGPVVRR